MTTKENFFEDVYAVVRLIPEGRVSTYGAIAAYLGRKGSARMVGWALNAAVTMPNVPAHRVVNRNGQLSGKGHFGEPTLMQSLLEAEGIKVKNDTVQNFKDLLWNPQSELL